ncbi:DUF2161 family putative PD-(D/E)XK-type phosphodiesterase [Anaerobacillus sp. CMMVII]|uniref:DUF2161 domain-containing phosphodiesterase n=1 Tax=Anaerobacillus sp. CMMVII TaxID=2755588 RepID=UPI0028E0A1B1|nr:DUF2161 family putative PD-(D/E)XK-type phosphodiesterase [Anaerobacillus sp. CMMVII]
MKEKRLEVDLYRPIQSYFQKLGFQVYGEVNDCDIVAVKDDEVIVIELKLSLTIELLIQATNRQRLTDQVYIAIPKPKYKLRSKRWADLCNLLKRLELGLILVSFSGKRKSAEVMFQPEQSQRIRVNKRKRQALLTEINGRSADYNVGGSTRTKIMTAYKENCIQIACYLELQGPLSPKALTELGTGAKTPSILTKNFYRWFDRVKRGVYVISEKGKQDLKEYPELVSYYLEKMVQVNKGEDDEQL